MTDEQAIDKLTKLCKLSGTSREACLWAVQAIQDRARLRALLAHFGVDACDTVTHTATVRQKGAY